MTTPLTVEVLTASGCSRCQRAKALAKRVVAELDDDRLQYKEISVVEEIDYAVTLGLLSAPAIALNGELVFRSLPSAVKLRQAILDRLA
jgi:thioredoxin